MRILLLLSIATLASCTVAPDLQFSKLETRLLTAREISVEYEIEATGAFQADFRGTLDMNGASTTWTYEGTFGGRPANGKLESSGLQFEVQTNEQRRAGSASDDDDVRESIVIGWTRMGLLHNLARMSSLAGPDHADGTAREWVTTEGHALDGATLSFDLVVSGQKAATAHLELDADGLPERRSQTVQFGEKSMTVVETYRFSSASRRALTSL